ncbi:LuxR C-terminal-related transcriptional regulator [Mucilaginibacter sp.]|nr:LuxR C-terminal-related transcriptional regulator [Mucilaginibacter sp.]
MLKTQRFELQNYLPEDFEIGQDFFDQVLKDKKCCIFLQSCQGGHEYIHLGAATKDLIGYSQEQFAKGGIDFWFSLIDPRDLPFISDIIITKFRDMMNPNFSHEAPTPIVLRYRLKTASGKNVWLKDTKYLLSMNKQGKPQQILCKIELSPGTKSESNEFDNLLNSQEPYARVLEAAMMLKNAKLKEPIGTALHHVAEMPIITKREKEILMLVGEGLSTKMIADRCHISINTVETHRRHLLVKLNAKNSMELIRQASRIFSL